jgi:hypothetical protein
VRLYVFSVTFFFLDDAQYFLQTLCSFSSKAAPRSNKLQLNLLKF